MKSDYDDRVGAIGLRRSKLQEKQQNLWWAVGADIKSAGRIVGSPAFGAPA